MSEKSIAITKNGYDILRIIKMKNKNKYEEKFSFKISPRVDNDKLKITYTKMYSLPKEISFDVNKTIELTYHKAEGIYKPKIHIKMIDKKDNSKVYEDLPLERIIEPNVSTKIPIPLLKIVVPEGVLTRKYEAKDSNKEFNIGNNNVIELFLTNSTFGVTNFFRDFPFISQVLFDDNFELYTSGVFRGKNMDKVFEEIGNTGTKTVMFWAPVTKDIGIFVVNIRDKDVSGDKLELNFIENEFYLPIAINRDVFCNGIRNLVYLFDLYWNVMFSIETKMKYKKWFEEQIINFLNYRNSHIGEYIRICNYYNGIDKNG